MFWCRDLTARSTKTIGKKRFRAQLNVRENDILWPKRDLRQNYDKEKSVSKVNTMSFGTK